MQQELVKKALNNLHQHKRKVENDYNMQMQNLLKDENYSKLQKQLAQEKINNAKKSAFNEAYDSTFEKQLEEKIEEIKRQHNIKPINYSCKICKDEGYIHGEMCECLKREMSKILTQESGFSSLESFEQSIKSSGNMLPLYQKLQMWCHGDFKKDLIYLAGQTGVGKTHLVKCMANELINLNKIVKLATAFNINLDFKDFGKTKNEELIKKYINYDILIIDDLGTEPLFKNVTIENFYLIINERKMRKKPTIITSNLTLDEIRDRYDERIYSRIVDRQSSITVYLEGQDLRTKR